MSRITIIRHGKPDFELKGMARSRDISDVIGCYDRSGITDTPPEAARERALACEIAVCSDLPRSLQSARALGFDTIHTVDPLFREVATPHFRRGGIAIPVRAWGVLLRSLSVFGFSRNGESLAMARTRAREAVDTLIELASSHDHVLLVGHGFMNYFIASDLLRRGWAGPKRPGGDYWAYGIYQNSKL
jgi:broad specificity phosphatase PhoE